MNSKIIKNLGDGIEIADSVNVGQLNEMESSIGKYIKAEIAKVDVSLKKYFNSQLNSQLNNTIVEYGYSNSLVCVFYLDNNQFNNGDKLSTLPDKKSFYSYYDANQNTESRKPTADDDLYFSYLNFRQKQCLTVDYNLNGKNNLHVFIVLRILLTPGWSSIGIFGNENNPYKPIDKFISIDKSGQQRSLTIGFGSGREQITRFPSKASPVTLNFSTLSVHYNSVQSNDSLVYCNGKYIANFTVESNSGGETSFSIGSITNIAALHNSSKHIAYFSLYHGRFNVKDIKIMHKYLCKRYRIDHDRISIP